MDFEKFIDINRERLYRFAEDNTKKNSDGIVVLVKDDEWRKEKHCRYVTSERFLKQPEQIQNVFKEWWKPEIYDLYADSDWEGFEYVIDSKIKLNLVYQWIEDYKNTCIFPLLSETQLRNFIEEKTNSTIDTELTTCGYDINFYSVNGDDIELVKFYNTQQKDLLQAYWYTACKIAEETN